MASIRGSRFWFVYRAYQSSHYRELEQIADNPEAEDRRRQRFNREPNQIDPDAKDRDHNTVSKTGGDTLKTDFADVKAGKGECDYKMAEDKNSKMAGEIRLGPPKRLGFHVGTLHQHSVPDPSKDEDKNKRNHQRDETSFVIHTLL